MFRRFATEAQRHGEKRGKWIKKAGERAVTLDLAQVSNSVHAIMLLKRDSKLLYVSSSCLRNSVELNTSVFTISPWRFSTRRFPL
jgi:hypothetical protein